MSTTEMKFRAYHPEWDEMVYNTRWNFNKREFTPFQFNVGFSDYPKDERWQIMQSTGLTDKNDDLIYDQDIVCCEKYPFYDDDQRNYVGVIDFINACFYVSLERVSDSVVGRACGGMIEEYHNQVKIIGNCYENPELLEIE